MASQVNKKFVITLAAVLGVLVMAAGGAGVYALKKSGGRHAKAGAALAAKGQIEDAYQSYGRAVSKDQTNVEWLTAYRDLIVQTVPKTREELNKRYQLYLGTLRNLAAAQPGNPEPVMEYINELNDRSQRGGWPVEVTKAFVDDCESMLRSVPKDSEAAKTIQWYIARARHELSRRTQMDESQRIETRTMLEQVLADDPGHYEAKMYLAMWHLDEAEQMFRMGLKQREDEERAESARLFEELLREKSDNLTVRVMDLARRVSEVGRTVTDPVARRAGLDGLKPIAQEALEVFKKTDAEELELRVLEGSRTMIPRVLGVDASRQMVEVAEKAYLKDQENPWLGLSYARLLMDAERFDDAIGVLDPLIAADPLPVSLEAVMQPVAQTSALAERVDAALFAAERSGDRELWLKRADTYLAEFERLAGAGDKVPVLLRRAKVSMMNDRFAEAVRDLSELETLGLGGSAEVRYMLSVALQRQGNLGGAKEKLESLIDDNQSSVQVVTALADVQMRLSEYDEAEETLRDALVSYPGEAEALQERLNAVMAAKGEGTDVSPVALALVESRKLRMDGDLEGAAKVISEAMKAHPDDVRLTTELIEITLVSKNRTEAKRMADAALAKWPDEERIQELEVYARVADENEAALEWIQKSAKTDLERALRRYGVYGRMGDAAAAERELAAAEKADPENAQVIAERFERALGTKNFEQARQYALKAASKNLDQYNGELFKGRLELAQGQYAAAVATFKAATDKIPHNPGAWSLYGDAQLTKGEVDGAIRSYAQAVKLRPGDADFAQRYARALARVGRGPEALAAMDELLRISPQRGPAYDLWLELQGAYGDRDSAMADRAKAFERDPSDANNAVMYYTLLLEEKQWDTAGAVLERLRADETVGALTLADMEAKLLGEQGRVDEGRAVYEKYLAGMGAQARTADYIAFGRYLESKNLTDGAVEMYRKARDAQEPGKFEGDFALSTYFMTRGSNLTSQVRSLRAAGNDAEADKLDATRSGLLEEAVASLQSILSKSGEQAEGDIGLQIRRSLAAVMTDLKQFDKAEPIIARIAQQAPDKDNDLQVLLLRSTIATQKKDLREARRLLDIACEKHPGNFEPLWERILLNKDDPALASVVEQDLTKITQLRPGMTEAWGMWFDIYRGQGRVNDALSAIRRGIQANPEVRELRRFLVAQLIDLNRNEEAQQVAYEGTQLKSDKAFWYQTAGELYARGEQWRQALQMFDSLYTLDKTTFNLVSYLDVILRQPTPDRGTVQRLLGELPADDELDLRSVMVAARGRAFFKQRERSQKLAQRGFVLCEDSWPSMAYWLGQAAMSEGSVERAMMLAETFKPTVEQVIPLMILGGNQLMATGSKPADVLSRLTILDTVELDDVSKFELLKLRAKLHYLMQEYPKAAALNKEAIDINPESLEVANDLAYLLAEDMHKPEEALPYAEQAVRLAPNSPTVLDTLGWVYRALGRMEDASRTLEKAADRARGRDNADEFIAIVHLGVVKAEMGDKRTAQELLNRADTLMKLQPNIKDYYPDAIEQLRRALQ